MTSKEEYLKRYLSSSTAAPNGGRSKKKRRKKIKDADGNVISVNKVKPSTKIVDQDAEDWLKSGESSSIHNINDLPEEDRPVIEGGFEYIDEADIQSKKSKETQRHQWKSLDTGNGGDSTGGRDNRSTMSHTPSARYTTRHDSPVRRNIRHDSPSPVRRNIRHDSPSPVRRNIRHDSPDLSPSRSRATNRHDSPSPVRRNIRHDSPDLSPPRSRATNRHDSPSPVRRSIRHDSPDLSPPRSRATNKHDSPSPVRRNIRQDSPDLSPPRSRPSTNRHDSPPPVRRNIRHDDSPDVCPDRGGGRSRTSNDNRNTNNGGRVKVEATVLEYDNGYAGRGISNNVKRMTDGTSAGLVAGKALNESLQNKRANQESEFSKLIQQSQQQGPSSRAVIRDSKTGRKVDAKLERLKKREEEQKEMERLEKYKKWGRGQAQEKSREEKMMEQAYESSKPFARSRDDKDLNDMLKEKEISGDPMAKFFASKKSSKKKPDKPRYTGSLPPTNRFNIWPGFRWDGVDRSNGFEKRLLSMRSNLVSRQEEALMWSTEDM